MGEGSTRNWSASVCHAVGVVKLIARPCMLACTLFFTLSIHAQNDLMTSKSQSTAVETITLAAGCFWCVEAVFENLEGVTSAVSGYMGGSIKNPSYREVCSGRTGHAEVVQVVYDPSMITTSTLLEVFFATHDPTTLNRQGADAGTQYRSAIFFHNEQQKSAAVNAIQKAGAIWRNAIVTEVTAASELYIAEDYHQAYYELNGEAPYCRAVILPKMKKLQSSFNHLLKIR